MKKFLPIITIIALLLSFCSLIYLYRTNQKLTALACDIIQSINAEREYVYPILRKIGNPDEVATNVKNPMTTKAEWNLPCLSE